jgi:hypothetical protein
MKIGDYVKISWNRTYQQTHSFSNYGIIRSKEEMRELGGNRFMTSDFFQIPTQQDTYRMIEISPGEIVPLDTDVLTTVSKEEYIVAKIMES